MFSSEDRTNKEDELEVGEEGEEEEVDSIWKELKLLGELPVHSGNFETEG